MTKGVLLLAHGARDANWATPFIDIAQRIRQAQSHWLVQLSYLEFMTPDLITGGASLVQAGCTHISVVPLFLGSGGHVRKDLPRLIEQLQVIHPTIVWSTTQEIGSMAPLRAALAQAVVNELMTQPMSHHAAS